MAFAGSTFVPTTTSGTSGHAWDCTPDGWVKPTYGPPTIYTSPAYPPPSEGLTNADLVEFRCLMAMMQQFMRSHEAIREQSLMELARHFGIEEAVVKALKEKK